MLDDTQALGLDGRQRRRLAALARIGGPDIGSRLAGQGVRRAARRALGRRRRARFAAQSATRVHCSPPSVAALHAAARALALNDRRGDALRRRLAALVRRLRDGLAAAGLHARGGLFPVQDIGPPQVPDPGARPPAPAQARRRGASCGATGGGPPARLPVRRRAHAEDIDRLVGALRRAGASGAASGGRHEAGRSRVRGRRRGPDPRRGARGAGRASPASARTRPARATSSAARAWLATAAARSDSPTPRSSPTGGHPVVCAAADAARRPTLLVYGHYDVQPPEPFGAWRTPPFEPVPARPCCTGAARRTTRASSSRTSQAIEAWLRVRGRLPVNVSCLFEGEEEIGSPSLAALRSHRDSLAADAALVSDTPMLGPGRPAITYALRGGLGLEIEVRRPGDDLHSGMFGGAVANPLAGAVRIVARAARRRRAGRGPRLLRRVRGIDAAPSAPRWRASAERCEDLRDARRRAGGGRARLHAPTNARRSGRRSA